MQAICSDVHGNLEAFEAVLQEIARQHVTEVICLGDVVGYGPNPRECVDLARGLGITLQGNHEQALLVQMEGSTFSYRARDSLDWTRQQFSMRNDEERAQNGPRWDFLGSLRESFTSNSALHVHGTPRDPINEYLYPRDIYRPEKLEQMFEKIDWVCFVGHTHVPGIWTEDMIYLTRQQVNGRYRLGPKKAIINVGSVGQPRDGDPRASFVLRDDDTIFFRRVEYPMDTTVQKIRAIPELDPFLAERLQHGK